MQEKYRRLRPLKREKYPKQEHFAHYLKSDLLSFFYKRDDLIAFEVKEAFLQAMAALHLRLVKRHKLAVFEGGRDEELNKILLGVDTWFLNYLERYDGLEGLIEDPECIEYPFAYIFEIKCLLITEYRGDLNRWQRRPYFAHLYGYTDGCEAYDLFERLVACTETEELFGKGMLITGNEPFRFQEDGPERFTKRIVGYHSKMAKHVLQIFVGFVNLNAEERHLYWRLDTLSVGRD